MRLVSVAVGVSVALCAAPVTAQEMPMQDVSYHEGFETGDDPVQFWTSNGEYEVNFKGVTDERAFEGTHSFKLDVSLGGGSYFYWHVPLRMPAEGELRFSARILAAEGMNASAGLGANWVFPPTRHSGCGPFESVREPTDEWTLIEGDLAAEGVSRAHSVMSKWVAGASGKDVGVYVDRWGIFIRGSAGERVVIYVDDVSIEGRVPEGEPYQAAIDERWEPFEGRWDERVAGWRERIEQARARIAELPELPERLSGVREAAVASVTSAEERMTPMAEQGYARPEEVDALESALTGAERAPATLSRVAQAAQEDRPLVTLPVRAISNARILPDQVSVPALPHEEMRIAACRGEYEAGSFVALALEDLDDVMVEPTPLRAGNAVIAADAIDVKVVKVWYQAGRGISDLDGRILVPELLVYDDALVRVDEDEQHNYLRSTGADGTEQYVLCSGDDSSMLEGVRPSDAETLQPLSLREMRPRQFWVTVHVPADAAGGVYRGALRLSAGGIEPMEVPLQVTVHDFDLEPAPLTYSVYYRGKLAEDNEPTITSERRSEEQYLAEMRDLQRHGVLYPTIYQGYHEELLARALELRAEAELANDQLFTLGVSTGAPQDEEAMETLRERVGDWLAMAERFGYDEVYVYGIDEARGDRLEAQRRAWRAVQEEGAGTFVACYHGTFEAMGDLLDVAVLAHRPDPEEAAKFHGVGSRVFTYSFPQVGPEEPETFRRNFGLTLWQADFDGAMDYAYQHGFGHVWNDFDSDRYRDHNFAYPTIDGVVTTVQLEGFREASDDTRYVATLQRAIEVCDDAEVAAEARAWLEELDPTGDLHEIRATMVAHIERCLGGR